MYSAIHQAISLGYNRKPFQLSPKEDHDIFVDFKVNTSSDLVANMTSVEKGSRIMTKISLNKETIKKGVLLNSLDHSYDDLLNQFKCCLSNSRDVSKEKKLLVAMLMAQNTLKDDFLNMANIFLYSVVKNLLKGHCEPVLLCHGSVIIENIIEKSLIPSVITGEDCIIENYETDLKTDMYLTTFARMNGKSGTSDLKVVCGNFTFKDIEELQNKNSLLDSYVSQRKEELLKQAEERLFGNDTHSIESLCERMLPLILFSDLFSSPTPFNPTKPSSQQLRDSVFIHYNVARIAHIRKIYDHMDKLTDKIDIGMLDLDIEWALICQLVNFEQVFEQSLIVPITKTGNQSQVTLSIHRIFQFLVKFVKLFSKYYSSTKVITYDQKESLVIRMNTRMLLVNSVFDLLEFCLTKIFGVPLVLII